MVPQVGNRFQNAWLAPHSSIKLMHHPERQPQRCNRTANEKQQQRQQQQRALPSLNQPIPVGRSVFFGGVHRAREVELERSSRRLCLLACCNCTRGKNIKSSNGIDHTGDGHTRTQETPPQPPPLLSSVLAWRVSGCHGDGRNKRRFDKQFERTNIGGRVCVVDIISVT